MTYDPALFRSMILATALYGAALAAPLFVAGMVMSVAPRSAEALPAYASQTGLPCGRCHVNSAGGGARTAFGNAFAANGHKLPSKKK
jgi:hypothetical protein